jgi:DNA-binding transcriptional ArsR family regulator
MSDEAASEEKHKKSEADQDDEDSDLRKKLEDISSRLVRIERILGRLEPEMGEFQSSTKLIREGMDFYGSLFEMMGRFTGRQRLVRRFPEIGKDEISRLMVEALEEGKPLNISQLTVAVRRQRGTASRRIVRERLQRLEELGIVEESHQTKKAVYYKLAAGAL